MRSAFKLGLGLILLVALQGCSSSSKKGTADVAKSPEVSDLTQLEAQSRKERVSDVKYKLFVKLNNTSEQFQGQMDMQFQLVSADQPLRLDFFEGSIQKLVVNGQTLKPEEVKSLYSLLLPSSSLKAGLNDVHIEYTAAYSKQGQGLHRFVDPETQEVFLYTQFEAYAANRFMPCFDQPDLRATLELKVQAPKEWQVVTTTRETSVTSEGENSLWTFPITPKLATYLFSLHAGPYQVWSDTYNGMSLRLFARPKMARFVRHKEWFQITKQGLKFFNRYFAYPYPFKKYDQLFVPEFNAGAMENVGAVTFSENFLIRGEVTRQDRRRAASVILHEMAHMWFGDVVTMKWWNDLWLNESFASYMAALALAEGTDFKESWQSFFRGDKQWAYWEDGLVTTHPIEGQVLNVKEAFATFDGITYGKGASVLKQLSAYMTPQAFQKGIQKYIAKYAYQNAEQKDFIEMLQEQTKRDLNVWSERWLRQSGTDTLSARWKCNQGKIGPVTLTVESSAGAQFRPQRVRLGLYKMVDGRLNLTSAQYVELARNETIQDGGSACPDFVYPNHGDDGYVAVVLDPKSLEFAKHNLSKFSDPLLRNMVWHNLWQMVRTGDMALKDYVEVVNQQFPLEQDPIVLDQIVSTISGRRGDFSTVLNYWPRGEESQKARVEFIEKVADLYVKRMSTAKPGSDDQKFWYDSYVSLAQTPKTLGQLVLWFKGMGLSKGLVIDTDRKWFLVRQLSRYSHPEAAQVLAELKSQDTSDRGKKEGMAVEAIQPDLDVKKKWVNVIKEPEPKLSFATVRTVAGALFPVEQKPMAKSFEGLFFDYVRKNGATENEAFVNTVAGALSPLGCEPEGFKKVQEFIGGGVVLNPSLRKSFRVQLQEDERCMKVRELSQL